MDAFSHVSARFPTARLIIAGKPASYFDIDGLQDQIRSSPAAEQIRLDSRYLALEEVGALLRMCRALALPYLSATQSGVLQLAYGQGAPTIASSVGTFPEMIENGRSGLLVPPTDATALSDALSRLLADAAFARQLGDRGKELSETVHSWSNVAQQVLKAVAP